MRVRPLLFAAVAVLFVCSVRCQIQGFVANPERHEQTTTFNFSPELCIHINAPQHLSSEKPTKIILYALPNGNTIEQTVGKQLREGVDWHFTIQHIGAQTRQLRDVVRDENIIVVYLEAAGKSFPQWRRKFPHSSELIARVVDTLRSMFTSFAPAIALSAHSGGGSFIFGYLNAFNEIPSCVKRISFLDSNYGYDNAEHHGDKLISWLRQSDEHFLSVIAYDDRFITVNGKRVAGDSGGTFRATHRMIERLREDVPLTMTRDSALEHYVGLNKHIDILIHTNPDTCILHTVLVERNGFIHSMTVGTKYEGRAGLFWGEPAYTRWITK